MRLVIFLLWVKGQMRAFSENWETAMLCHPQKPYSQQILRYLLNQSKSRLHFLLVAQWIGDLPVEPGLLGWPWVSVVPQLWLVCWRFSVGGCGCWPSCKSPDGTNQYKSPISATFAVLTLKQTYLIIFDKRGIWDGHLNSKIGAQRQLLIPHILMHVDAFWFKFWCILWIFGQVAFVIFAEFASCLAMAIFTDSLASRSLDQRTAAFANVQVFQNLGTALGSAIYGFTLLSFQAETD